MARRALPLLLLLAVVVAVAAAPAQGETIELGSRRWLEEYAMAPAEGPTAADPSSGAGYISYGALTANRVPCPVGGASYYNCVVGAEANPYSRGCPKITLCRN